MSQVTLALPAAQYLDGVLETTLFDVLVKIVAARARRRRVRAAFVGNDPHLLTNLEAMHDSLIDFSDPAEADIASDPNTDWRLTFNCYAGPPGDTTRPSKPVDQLVPCAHDLIVIADAQPQREADLVKQVMAIPRHEEAGGAGLVVPFTRLRNAFVTALLNLRAGAYFTALNARKTAATVVSFYLAAAGASGCVVECGTYLGGTSILMGLMLHLLNDPRRVHTFDTFEGLPTSTGSDGQTIFRGGQFTETSLPAVQQFIQAHGMTGRVHAHKGLIQDELPKLWGQENEVAFCFADTDQYAGTDATLKTVLPRLHANGLILVDDYFEHGVRRAVQETFQAIPQVTGALICHSMFLLWKTHAPGR